MCSHTLKFDIPTRIGLRGPLLEGVEVGKRQCLDHGTAHGPKSLWLESVRAIYCWPPQSTPSLFSEATSPKENYCLQTGGSEPLSYTLSPDPEFAPNLRSSRKGVLGTGGISSFVTTPLPRLSLVSWLKLLLEAAPGALVLASSILRHSKRVFRQMSSGRSSGVGCACLPEVCAQPGGLAAGHQGEAVAVGLAVLAEGLEQGSPTAGGPVSSTVPGSPTASGKPCKYRSS